MLNDTDLDLLIPKGGIQPDGRELWNRNDMRNVLRAAQQRVQRTAIAAFFVGGFVFLGIRWIVFGG